MSFPMYPEYKYSDAEWLGKVPNNWTVAAIKWLSPVLRGASPRPIDDPIYFDDDGEYGWVRISDVTASKDGYLKGTTQKLSAIGSSLSVKLEPGKLFLSIAGSVGKPCITKIQACIHDGFVYFPLLNIDQRFLYRIFELGSCFGGLGKMGTQLNLNTDTVGGILIAIPPMTDLTNILRFLDYETAKIDTLIHEQKRLIKLLKEKRQAVISHAVTKGLDPDVPMKDSGVEWLGEVPAHWVTTPIKRVINLLEQGWSPQCENQPVESTEEFGVLKVGCVNRGVFRPTENKRLPQELSAIPELTVKAGDLLISRANTRELVGSAAVSEMDHPNLMISDKLFRIRLNQQMARPHFVSFFLGTLEARLEIEIAATGASSSMLNIGQGTILNMPFPCPPASEQEKIVQEVAKQTHGLSELMREATALMELLHERRSALISAAVAGKIDVRNWQPPADESAFDEEVRPAEMEVTA